MAEHLATTTTTQSQHPWRATIRTAVAVVLALASMAPLIYSAIAQDDPGQATGAAGGALAIAMAITRLAALPAVETFLQRFVPWLAAAQRGDPTATDAAPAETSDGAAAPQDGAGD